MKNVNANKLRVVVSRNAFGNPTYQIQRKSFMLFWKDCFAEMHSPKKIREVLKSWGVNYKDVNYVQK